jgi:hypothetical protein
MSVPFSILTLDTKQIGDEREEEKGTGKGERRGLKEE